MNKKVKEEWRPVKNFEGLYEVSNCGNVRSLKRIGNRPFGVGYYGGVLLKQSKTSGYQRVSLCKNNKKTGMFVHRLVADAFIPNPDNYPQVNHKDEVKTNNCVENLEWCTVQYNCNYGTCKERRAKSHSVSKKCKHILQYDLYGNFIKEWVSASEAARQLNASHGNIWMCCLGERRQTKGFMFKFK